MSRLFRMIFIMAFLFGILFHTTIGQNTDMVAIPYELNLLEDEIPPEIENYLQNVQNRLDEFDISLTFERWDVTEAKPEDAIAYLRFDEIIGEDNTSNGIVVNVETNTDLLHEISPILYSNLTVPFNLDRDDAVEGMSGILLYATSQLDDAEQILEQMVFSLESPNTYYAFLLANINIYQQDYEQAEYYLKYTEDTLETPVNTNGAWLLFHTEREEEAFQILDNLISMGSYYNDVYGLIELYSIRARFYALAFDYDAAIADMDTAIELAPGDASLYTLRGQMILLLYEWDRAMTDYDTAIDLDPTYADAYFYRGVLRYTLARREEALSDFNTYLELASTDEHSESATQYAEDIQIELDALGN